MFLRKRITMYDYMYTQAHAYTLLQLLTALSSSAEESILEKICQDATV